MMTKAFQLLYIIIVPLLLLFSGCEIEKFEGSSAVPEGSLYVSTVDNENAAEITGATIFLDDLQQLSTTPAWLHGISEGSHTIRLEKFGYYDYDAQVSIIGGDTTYHEASIHAASQQDFALLTVHSEPHGAEILIDGHVHKIDDQPALTPLTLEIPWGSYRVSVYKENFATVTPILPEIRINAGDSTGITFTLEEHQTGLELGQLPPPFRLGTVDEDTVRLGDLMGQVVLINFWYTECHPCIEEFPGIEAIFQEFRNQDFHVLAINPMNRDDKDDIIRFREDLGLNFRFLMDQDLLLTRDLYSVRAFPKNVLVDRSGRISLITGSITEDDLRQRVQNLVDPQ